MAYFHISRSVLIPMRLAYLNLTALTHPLRETPKIQAKLWHLSFSIPQSKSPFSSGTDNTLYCHQPLNCIKQNEIPCPAKLTKSPPSAARTPSAMDSLAPWTALLSLTCAENVIRACRWSGAIRFGARSVVIGCCIRSGRRGLCCFSDLGRECFWRE